jgi:hypothetical protein
MPSTSIVKTKVAALPKDNPIDTIIDAIYEKAADSLVDQRDKWIAGRRDPRHSQETSSRGPTSSPPGTS